MRNNLLDEFIADFAGLAPAFGRYDAGLELRFLGLEAYPAYRPGRPVRELPPRRRPCRPRPHAILQGLVVRAARAIEAATADADRRVGRRSARRFVVALAGCTSPNWPDPDGAARLARGAAAAVAAASAASDACRRARLTTRHPSVSVRQDSMSEPAKTTADATVPVVSVPEGDYVFRTGDPAHSFFIVSTGQVELLRRGETHGRLALLDAGDVVGEDSAFEGQVRACDARAMSPGHAARGRGRDVHRPGAGEAGTGRRPHQSDRREAAAGEGRVPGRWRSRRRARRRARFVHVESGSQFLLPSSDDVVVGRADPRTTFTAGRRAVHGGHAPVAQPQARGR